MHFPDAKISDQVPPVGSPPAYAPSPASAVPRSGYRIPLAKASTFPNPQQCGPPPSHDLDGSPLYIGSAIFENSVHPCKIAPALSPPCLVPYAGTEHHHEGRYDLLPFNPITMEFVRTSRGQIPAGRLPIEGGYEDNGNRLYHGMAVFNGVRVPGKTGVHLDGCNVSFGGGEHVIKDNYDILCWK